jgi:hypothetical protein
VTADAGTVMTFVSGLAEAVHAHLDTAAQLAELQQFCGGDPFNFELLEEVAADVDLKQQLWTSKGDWAETRTEWLGTQLFALNVPAMEEQVCNDKAVLVSAHYSPLHSTRRNFMPDVSAVSSTPIISTSNSLLLAV